MKIPFPWRTASKIACRERAASSVFLWPRRWPSRRRWWACALQQSFRDMLLRDRSQAAAAVSRSRLPPGASEEEALRTISPPPARADASHRDDLDQGVAAIGAALLWP